MNDQLEQNLIQRLSVGDIMRRSALRMPGREALVEYRGDARNSYSYREMNQNINKFVRALRGLGLQKGDRVAAVGLNSVEYVMAFWGLARGGYVMVPVNPGLTPSDMGYIINHSEAKALIADDVFVPALSNFLDKAVAVKNYICLPVTGQKNVEPFIAFNELIAGQSEEEVEDVIVRDRDILQIMYTSGTTATPKGVMITNLSLYVTALQNVIFANLNPGNSMSVFLPLFHCAQQSLLISAMLVGAKAVIMRGFDPGSFMKMLGWEKINFIFALPMMYRALLDYQGNDECDFSSIERCIYAMTPMDQRTLGDARKKFTSARFTLATGQTEAYPSTNYFDPQDYPGKEGNYWGISNLTYETTVMDDEGHQLARGEIGEICWRGPGIMEGYYKDEAATERAGRFGWHHSGDLGYFDEDGLLVFVDRKKDMIKTGGENVSSIKVERVLLGHPQIESAAVVGLPHSRWIEAVTAFVVVRDGSGLTEQDVIGWCKQELGGFEVPKTVIFVKDLPRTSTGKIKKHEIRRHYQNFHK
jgi:long-chain acyl-CoA synthetase